MQVMRLINNCLTQLKKILYSNQGVAFLMGIFVALALSTIPLNQTQSEIKLNQETKLTTVTVGPHFDYAKPVKLRIPKIDSIVDFSETLGLVENGEVAVPKNYTTVGWYKYSPTPGEIGPAVVLGHVDSYQGPAVFYKLKDLVPGDDIYIDREDGSIAHFVINSLENYKQSEFPTQVVYGDINYAGLRLITCSGIYNQGKQRYSHNLVVFASLVE